MSYSHQVKVEDFEMRFWVLSAAGVGRTGRKRLNLIVEPHTKTISWSVWTERSDATTPYDTITEAVEAYNKA